MGVDKTDPTTMQEAGVGGVAEGATIKGGEEGEGVLCLVAINAASWDKREEGRMEMELKMRREPSS